MKRTLLAVVPAGWAAVLLAIGFWPLAAQVRGSEDEARVRPHLARGDAPDFPDFGSRLGGPVLGLLFDRGAGALRPILGVPGAASVGSPLDVGAVLTLAAVAPGQRSAVAVAGEDSRVIVIRVRDVLEASPVEGATPGPERIVMSPSGSAAALYYPEGRIEILRGLPDAPTAGERIDLAGLGSELTALAIDDNGQTALAALSREDGGAVYLLGPGRAPQLALLVRRASAIAFVPETADVLVADGPENRIYLIRDVNGGAGSTVLAGAEQGIASPVAIAVARRKAVVANQGSRELVTVDLESGTAIATGCDCEPSRLERLAGTAVFRLTDAGSGPIWIFDGDAAEARALFVPAPVPADAGERP